MLGAFNEQLCNGLSIKNDNFSLQFNVGYSNYSCKLPNINFDFLSSLMYSGAVEISKKGPTVIPNISKYTEILLKNCMTLKL